MIFAVDRILDMCRTTVNVTGDATVASIIAYSENEMEKLNQHFSKLFTITLLILVSLASYAQHEICDEPLTGSVKNYEKGNYKKYNYKQRVKFFKDALQIEEECVPCIWELAKMSFRRRYSLVTMDFPKKYFLQLSQLCPQYHADVLLFEFNILYGEK